MIPLKICQTLDEAYAWRHAENVRDARHGNPKRKMVVEHVVGALKNPPKFLVSQLEAGEFEELS